MVPIDTIHRQARGLIFEALAVLALMSIDFMGRGGTHFVFVLLKGLSL